MDRTTAAAAIVAAGRRLGARGLISAGEGNLSVRLDGSRILISPTGRRKDELTADDLIVVRLDHEGVPDVAPPRSVSGLRPSSDLAIHLAVHAARPELGAVVHAHLPASMTLTLAGEVPDPAVLPETGVLLPRLPALSFGEMGSAELAARVADALTAGPEPLATAVLLERHGAVAVGPDAAIAVDRLELIEVLCRTWRDALLVRAARASLDAAGIVWSPTAPEAPRPPGALMEEG
ncbi:MAG TPA: class II aldolase/adducin family protein [Candidatus Saccharimonadales bacterium]|nr:class II aldolase/adducin family protein [Candidatus Saccharimonadales bacterium]